MLFRTTSQTNTNQAIRFVSNFNSNIAKYQRQISSGVRLERASDDPVSFRQVTTLSTQLQHLQSDALAVDDLLSVVVLRAFVWVRSGII